MRKIEGVQAFILGFMSGQGGDMGIFKRYSSIQCIDSTGAEIPLFGIWLNGRT